MIQANLFQRNKGTGTIPGVTYNLVAFFLFLLKTLVFMSAHKISWV